MHYVTRNLFSLSQAAWEEETSEFRHFLITTSLSLSLSLSKQKNIKMRWWGERRRNITYHNNNNVCVMCSECQKALFVYVTQSMLSSLSPQYTCFIHRTTVTKKNPVTFTIACIILICSLLLLFGVFFVKKVAFAYYYNYHTYHHRHDHRI